MAKSRIIQYIHRPTLTELGLGNTHDRYLVVDSDKDLSNIFPLGVEISLLDSISNKVYKVYSKMETNEFRLKRLGDIVDDYHMEPGDEIVITHYELSDSILDFLTVNECGRILLNPGRRNNGKIEDFEIVNIERLPGFSEDKSYSYACEYNGSKNELLISFSDSRKKRTDSPSETKFYTVKFGGEYLKFDSRNYYYLTIRNDLIVLKNLPKSDYQVLLEERGANEKGDDSKKTVQQIFYGAPGTGKSHSIKGDANVKEAEKGNRVFRTTFHPDSDYSTFVGCYKPSMKSGDKIYSAEELSVKLKEIKNTGVPYPCHKFAAKYWRSLKDLDPNSIKHILLACGFTEAYGVEVSKGIAIGQEFLNKDEDGKIIYTFTPQAFTNAYVKAWNTTENVYLIIEEINRGNCAQIFGDLFQLLDRGDDGKSEYPIDSDTDLGNYIAKELENSSRSDFPDGVKDGKKLVLPSNLFIWATMNTSDQSLFPIDSAFKRRWDWVYMPIENAEKGWKIKVNGNEYDWYQFLAAINKEVFALTHSEDKQLGYFFAKAKGTIIDAETLVNKVYFYLWTDVFKDYDFESQKAFRKPNSNEPIAFKNFFEDLEKGEKVNERVAEQVLVNLELEKLNKPQDLFE